MVDFVSSSVHHGVAFAVRCARIDERTSPAIQPAIANLKRPLTGTSRSLSSRPATSSPFLACSITPHPVVADTLIAAHPCLHATSTSLRTYRG